MAKLDQAVVADTKTSPAADEAFGVYVHWPFCLSKCPYCDFNSHVRHAEIDEARFVRAFAAEIAATAARVPGRTVSTIFFGGGTPSLMEPQTVGAILDAVAQHWTVAPDVEVTLEANPTSVEATRFAGYRAAGVNRVSLGVQALDDAALKALGRMHTADEALAAVAIARGAFRALFVRPHLCAARPDRAGLARRARRAPSPKRPSISRSTSSPSRPETPFAALHAAGKLAVPDDDHARDALRPHPRGLRRRRPAGLRDLQPRAAGRRVPPQPRLLALPRICRHRPRRPWPPRHRRPPPRHRDREAARGAG